MKIKENIPVIVGLSIPVLMIVFIGLSIYLPALFTKPPQYDFLYASGADYNSLRKYDVKKNKLVAREVTYPEHFKGVKEEPVLFVHDVTKNESREISFEEAQKLVLNSKKESPDGFEVVSGGYGGSILYSRGNYGTHYLKGHHISKELNLQEERPSGQYCYYGCFQFIGWIER